MKKILLFLFCLALVAGFVSCASTGSGDAPKAAAAKPAATPAAALAPLVLDNFEGQTSGGKWGVYDDVKDNKGSSKANPDPWAVQADPGKGAKGSDHFGKCWGTVTTKYQYGFGGVGYDFDADDKTKTLDITGYKGIHFWMKGDGKAYSISVKSPSANKDFCYYTYQIETSADWTEYTIDFSKFHQPSWGAATSRKSSFSTATGIQFQTIGQPIDKFEFYFDEFNLY